MTPDPFFFTELVYDHVGFTVLQIQGSLETHVADACAVMWPQPSTKMHQLRYILYAEYSCFRFIATPFEFQVTLEPSWGHNSKMKKKKLLYAFRFYYYFTTLHYDIIDVKYINCNSFWPISTFGKWNLPITTMISFTNTTQTAPSSISLLQWILMLRILK